MYYFYILFLICAFPSFFLIILETHANPFTYRCLLTQLLNSVWMTVEFMRFLHRTQSPEEFSPLIQMFKMIRRTKFLMDFLYVHYLPLHVVCDVKSKHVYLNLLFYYQSLLEVFSLNLCKNVPVVFFI